MIGPPRHRGGTMDRRRHETSAPSGFSERDAGRVSVFLAIALLGVFMIIGLSYDAAGQLSAMQRAQNLAAEAARAGGQEIDQAAAINGEIRLDHVAARRAVDAYRTAAGVTGPPADFPPPGPDGVETIHVEVFLTYEPVLLSFFGWDTVTVRGEATARLLTEEP